MSGYENEPEDLSPDDYINNYCDTCNGTGEINDCIDDLCANNDTCIHGDGIKPCPDCNNWM